MKQKSNRKTQQLQRCDNIFIEKVSDIIGNKIINGKGKIKTSFPQVTKEIAMAPSFEQIRKEVLGDTNIERMVRIDKKRLLKK